MQGGSFLYDQTFNVPLSDPAVQAAITQAQNLLRGAGANSFIGPTQLSSNTTQVSSQTNTVQTGRQTTQAIVGVNAFVGPQTITTGNLGVCQSYTLDPATPTYAIPTGCSLPGTQTVITAGSEDIDTRTTSLVTVSQTATTTNTFLTSQVYELDGSPQSGAPPPTPVPPTLILTMTGLAGAGCVQLFRRRRRGG